MFIKDPSHPLDSKLKDKLLRTRLLAAVIIVLFFF